LIQEVKQDKGLDDVCYLQDYRPFY